MTAASSDVVARIPLHVRLQRTAGLKPRRGEPVSVGVPLPVGICFDEARLFLQDTLGHPAPHQAAVLERWHDASIRWLLLHWRADSPGAYELLVTRGDQTAAGLDEPLVIDRSATHPRLRVGAMLVALLPSADCLFAAESDVGNVRAVKVVATDRDGEPARIVLEAVSVEGDGPLQTTVHVSGSAQLGDAILRLEITLQFFAGLPVVRLSLIVHNPRRARHERGFWELGDRGSVFLRDLSIRIASDQRARRVICRVEPGVQPVVTRPPLELYQASSGGPNWRSPVHVNREGRIPLQFCGYRLRTSGAENSGLRASPVVVVEYPSGCTAAAARFFWQNFPKAVEAGETDLTIRLFPGQYRRSARDSRRGAEDARDWHRTRRRSGM